MDPTMGQAPIGMSGFLTREDQIADQSNQVGTELVPNDTTVILAVGPDQAILQPEQPVVVDTPPAPPLYPVGIVDFNKPFEVFDENDDSYNTDARILVVLQGTNYPVVVVSTNRNGEQIVGQFDTDGDEQNGELKIENLDTEPRTLFGLVIRDGKDLSLHDELFGNEQEARTSIHLDSSQTIALVFPVTIPGAAVQPPSAPEAEETDTAGTVATEPQDPNARWVAGKLVKPGDKVTAYRSGYGERQVTVIKTRDDSRKSLFVHADNDNSEPYWALNKNIRRY